MNWARIKIKNTIHKTSMEDPRRLPNQPFQYIDISGIDRDTKSISTTTQYYGEDAPSRARKKVYKGDVLISTVRPNLNAVAVVPDELDGEIASTGFCILRQRQELLYPRFLYYYSRTNLFIESILKHVRGANYPAVTEKNILEEYFHLPSLSEQRKIVEILDQADALRLKRREADAKTAKILPALFYKMFGDPATNPMGWEIKTLKKADAEIRYGLGQPPAIHKNGTALIRATNINKGEIDLKNMIYVNPDEVPPNRNAFLKKEEVLVVRSGAYTGDIAQVTEKWEGSVAGYDLVINPGKMFTGEFIEQYMLSPFIQNYYFANIKARAGQPHLNRQQVANTPILCIPLELQRKFSNAVKNIRKAKEHQSNRSIKQELLFSTLLHNAFIGNLTQHFREKFKTKLEKELANQLKAISR